MLSKPVTSAMVRLSFCQLSKTSVCGSASTAIDRPIRDMMLPRLIWCEIRRLSALIWRLYGGSSTRQIDAIIEPLELGGVLTRQGVVAGIVVWLGVWFNEGVLKVDDPSDTGFW